jgi:hypothetical protein
MKITKTQLKTILIEEVTKGLVLKEARTYLQTNNRIDEGFLSDMSKKFGLPKKAVLAMLAMSTAAGVINPSQALANDDMFASMMDNALDQTTDAAQGAVDKAGSLELGKEVGSKIVELLQANNVDSSTKLILDARVGPIYLVRADGDSYQEGMADSIKKAYNNLEVDTDTSYTVSNVPKGTLVIQVDLTPMSPNVDVAFTILDAKGDKVADSQAMVQKIPS